MESRRAVKLHFEQLNHQLQTCTSVDPASCSTATLLAVVTSGVEIYLISNPRNRIKEIMSLTSNPAVADAPDRGRGKRPARPRERRSPPERPGPPHVATASSSPTPASSPNHAAPQPASSMCAPAAPVRVRVHPRGEAVRNALPGALSSLRWC